jgi:hypothetical protein
MLNTAIVKATGWSRKVHEHGPWLHVMLAETWNCADFNGPATWSGVLGCFLQLVMATNFNHGSAQNDQKLWGKEMPQDYLTSPKRKKTEPCQSVHGSHDHNTMEKRVQGLANAYRWSDAILVVWNMASADSREWLSADAVCQCFWRHAREFVERNNGRAQFLLASQSLSRVRGTQT